LLENEAADALKGRGSSLAASALLRPEEPLRFCSLLLLHRACYGVLRFVMESGAKGCEVIVSGKLRAARAKSMKFKDGYMVSSGHPVEEYIDFAVRHVMLRQGVLGLKVPLKTLYSPFAVVFVVSYLLIYLAMCCFR